MDTEAVSIEDYHGCLKDLSQVNIVTLTHRPVLAWLDHVFRRQPPGQPLTILDVGYGYGDLLRHIHRWSMRHGRAVNLVGIDLNPFSETIARAATPPGMPITYLTGNVFNFVPEDPIDIVLCSQTAHHMTEQELVAFVRWMEDTATRGWFIADLHRHAIPIHAFRLLSRLAHWHRFVQHDGPVSIARSFRRNDWEEIIDEAGIDPSVVEISWHVPFRLCVSRLK
ncbi:methyltransferase domain-containing protein [Microvirga puerhi]|uniref:Methyltransferase domain-containing protein n=1 Tax=Microvirga puerhi TaxID=2876078 RepID=A0ABS7VN54_9HYPH|nr:methyltransferase domain-containing protein [Microvirga puerhi]MBZ6076963.1 methyltransferase domain-containing protein [Microvirga puerhi]